MELLSLIRAKRRGAELSTTDIQQLVTGIVDHSVADSQLAALLMAICYEGLSYQETFALTRAFIDSGVTLDWSHLPGPVVDKHSTGGVGDKVSLLLMPWLAAAGLTATKMSGRSLGHTGGTIDKLESIPGFNVNLTGAQMAEVINDVGCCVVAQGADLVPADKIVYALRDATDTVDELGLIAASVISKKVAAGADYIVLDVKCGSGAFFTSLARARKFAQVALRLGRDLGKQIGCVISNMDQPLGRTIGNILEVHEVLDILNGQQLDILNGQQTSEDVVELCATLGGVLLALSGKAANASLGRQAMLDLPKTGAVGERFERWIAAQRGDVAQLNAQASTPNTTRQVSVQATRSGVVAGMNTRKIGEIARRLGAGRLTKDDRIDPWAGILCVKKVGDTVEAGEVLAYLFQGSSSEPIPKELLAEYQQTITISSYGVELPQVVLEVLPPNRGLSVIGG